VKKFITILLFAIILISSGLAAVIHFWPELIPEKFSKISEFSELKVLLPAVGSALLVFARLAIGYAKKKYRISQRRKGKLYGRAVFQPHFLKQVIREGKNLFVISWKNDGRVAEGQMPWIYGSEDDAEEMQRIAKETTQNPLTVLKNLTHREQRIAYTGAIAYFCKNFIFSRKPKYKWVVFSANEDAETLGVTLSSGISKRIS